MRANSVTEGSKLIMPSDVWVIGDSHVSAFAADCEMITEFPDVFASPYPNVKVCRLGPQLAGTLNRPNSSTGGRWKAFQLIQQISNGAHVYFSFGEIDCRSHVLRRASYNPEMIEGVIRETVSNYVCFVEDFRAETESLNLTIGLIAQPRIAQEMAYGSAEEAARLLDEAIEDSGAYVTLNGGRE